MGRTKHTTIALTMALVGAGYGLGRLASPDTGAAFAHARPGQDPTGQDVGQDAGQNAGQDPAADAAMQAMIEAGTPGEEHQRLADLAGTYEGTVQIWEAPGAEPMTMRGTLEREMIMGGRYLKENVTSETEWGPFEGMSLTGFNNLDGRYEVIWVDNYSTPILHTTGVYNERTKTFHFREDYRDPATGRIRTGRSVWDVSNPDRQVMRAYAFDEEGTEYKTFQAVFERTDGAAE